MKHFLLILYLNTVSVAVTNSFYDLQFESLNGTTIKTSAYQGKKVVVAVVSAHANSISLVRYLDSVQKANTGVQVIAIPTGDFRGSVNMQDLKDLKKSLAIILTKPLRVKKNNAALQHPLFKWLTKATENKHFDMDVQDEGQVFVISERGTLYSVLPKNAPMAVIGKVISQRFDK